MHELIGWAIGSMISVPLTVVGVGAMTFVAESDKSVPMKMVWYIGVLLWVYTLVPYGLYRLVRRVWRKFTNPPTTVIL